MAREYFKSRIFIDVLVETVMGEKFYRIVKLLVKIVQILLSKLFAEIFVHQLSHMVNW